MTDIKVGDIVRFKLSGSPKMIVNAVVDDVVYVIYITELGIPNIVYVNKETLKLIKSNGE